MAVALFRAGRGTRQSASTRERGFLDPPAPLVTPANTEDIDSELAGLYASLRKARPTAKDYRERNANLWADTQLRELNHFSKRERLREKVSEDRSGPVGMRRNRSMSNSSSVGSTDYRRSLRMDGCELVNQQMKRIAAAKPALPQVGAEAATESSHSFFAFPRPDSASQSADACRRSTERFQKKMQWRSAMDGSLKRLMLDVELMQDQDTLKDHCHKSRCDHLDKVYDWYTTHGLKEDKSQEKQGPAHLWYNPNDSVMPGSLRATPLRFEIPVGFGLGGGGMTLPLPKRHEPGGMRGSISQPSLLAPGPGSSDVGSVDPTPRSTVGAGKATPDVPPRPVVPSSKEKPSKPIDFNPPSFRGDIR